MSEYKNVVAGKLKLKGEALDVKASGVKKRKKNKHKYDKEPPQEENEAPEGELQADEAEKGTAEKADEEHQPPAYDDQLTPAERRYIEQRERIDVKRMAKTANKSHRDRIQDFNQYLANLSEHYDIPKVGPG